MREDTVFQHLARLRCTVLAVCALVTTAMAGCGSSGDSWDCVAVEEEPDSLAQIGCDADFQAISSEPLNASIPGARSAKTIVDRLDENRLHFQNSRLYPVHYDFASMHLSGNGLPLVPLLAQFNQTEYFSPDRRFLLGALTYYEGPAIWTYEISPYDTSSAEMIELAYTLIAENTYFGEDLYFHPTSDQVATEAEKLPDTVKVITTEELFAEIDYQPLNLGVSMGQLHFYSAAELEESLVSFRDIVILDSVPNDIAVVSGIVTATFQTPLSHINVLSQNRGTPNMALRGSFDDTELRALDGKWVRLEVGPFAHSITEVTQAEADEWWESHRPDTVSVPNLDLSVTDLRDIEDVLDIEGLGLGDALAEAIPAFGGKASHYGALTQIGEDVPVPKAFAIPVYYYMQFLEQNGFDVQIDDMLADNDFRTDAAVRSARLQTLREAMRLAPVDEEFEAMLLAKLASDYPGVRMRFRSSTNAEDLDGFTGAGLYTSRSGDPNDPLRPVLDAIRTVWSSVWYYRAFDEREYRGIDHKAVGMALLVHNSFPDEEANGVAVTANLFDPAGLEPGFYVNVQIGDNSVVLPDPDVTSDQFIFHYELTGQPIVYLAHSSLIPEGETVLTRAQTQELGVALAAIHSYFNDLYGPATPDHFYAMDVEFKFDDKDVGAGQPPALFVKQARPYPGRGSVE